MSSPSLIQLQSGSPQGEASLLAELQEIVEGYRQWSDGGSWEKQGRRWGDVVREKEPYRAALQLLPEIKAPKRRKRNERISSQRWHRESSKILSQGECFFKDQAVFEDGTCEMLKEDD